MQTNIFFFLVVIFIAKNVMALTDSKIDTFHRVFDNKDFYHQNCDGVNYTKSIFKNGMMISSSFENCDFSDVTFEDCDLSNISFKNTTFKNVKFKNTLIKNLIFKDTQFDPITLSFLLNNKVTLENISYNSSEPSQSEKVGFLSAEEDLSCHDFKDVDVQKGHFISCQMKSAKFREKDLSGAEFTSCTIFRADFDGANLDGAIFSNCTIDTSSFRGASLKDTSFNNCTLKENMWCDATIVDTTIFNGKIINEDRLGEAKKIYLTLNNVCFKSSHDFKCLEKIPNVKMCHTIVQNSNKN